MRKKMIVLLVISILLSATNLAAATSVTPDQEIKVISPGTCGYFDLTVTPSYSETAYLRWDTNNPVTAWIAPPAYSGTTTESGRTSDFGVTSNVRVIHKMDVCMASGAPSGVYEIWVEYFGNASGRFKLRAVTEPAAMTPEANTGTLMGVGLLGMFGLVAMKRRKT